ncbi:helix-turn-helix domain-containing protein [Sulfobacillus sp. hq2]|uniref:helix-turn-helix domain-containing protein n=1 Tax=Sulfobacillus sp. hq2 TaxID=2039167 RepID=UPI000CD2D207|nr:helix-turn-helix domain-containing protein [Sulfobacillus sp. hq2]POB11504.1 hypothetical protein CO251_04340 [Sulfobacillus sp. hq2]
MTFSPKPSTYSYTDRLFLRWVEQTDWPANTKRVCRVLFAHQRKHAHVYLLHSTIAAWLGISVATVKRAIRFLVKLGLLHVTPQFRHDGGQGSNRYQIVPRILADSTPPAKIFDPAATSSAAYAHDTQTPPVMEPRPHRIIKDQGPSTPPGESTDGSHRSALSSETATPPQAQAFAANTQDTGSTANPPPAARPHDVTSLGDILTTWADKHGVLAPTMTREEAHTDPGGRVTPMPLSEASTALAGSTPQATVKNFVKKKINNRNSHQASDSHVKTVHGEQPTSVVVHPETSLKPTTDTSPSRQPAPTRDTAPQGENSKAAPEDSPWIQNLLRIGTRETIERVIAWYRACPPHHPARPKHPAAWIYTAVKQNWQTPPTWMTPKASPPRRYRIVRDEEAWSPSGDTTSPAEDTEWTTITTWLASETAAAQEFLSQVEQTLYERLGGTFARQALASRGPLWQATCRELWRTKTARDVSA